MKRFLGDRRGCDVMTKIGVGENVISLILSYKETRKFVVITYKTSVISKDEKNFTNIVCGQIKER